jgi:hypothetical protein
MSRRFSALALLLCSTSLLAAPKGCEVLKQEIEVKSRPQG